MSSGKQVIIIVGAARSGTKFLRDSLAAASEVVAVPYDIGYVWRFGNESFPNDALPAQRCDDEVAAYIRSYILGFGQVGDRIVEKTVGNSLRVGFARRVFPEAKFVSLIRDGRAVVESSYRQWREPPKWKYLFKKARSFPAGNLRYGMKYGVNLLRGLVTRRSGARIWGPRYPGIESDVARLSLVRVCARQWTRCVQSSLEEFEQIPAEQRLEVRYEDFVKGDEAVLGLCRFAGIEDAASVESYVARKARQGMSRWAYGLTASQRSEAMEEMGDLLKALGY